VSRIKSQKQVGGGIHSLGQRDQASRPVPDDRRKRVLAKLHEIRQGPRVYRSGNATVLSELVTFGEVWDMLFPDIPCPKRS
jgi:hypothetical protein